ncbi:hypothetical protein GCM10027612_20060 [Microbispora bryophytorum subsp. camponoti]
MMTTEYAKAREVAEQARETEWTRPSFGKQLFLGDFQLDLVYPARRLSEEEIKKGDDFLRALRAFLQEKVDPSLIERTAVIPDEVVKGLAAIGAFGMTTEEEYGGLGLSHLYYCRALALVTSCSPRSARCCRPTSPSGFRSRCGCSAPPSRSAASCPAAPGVRFPPSC